MKKVILFVGMVSILSLSFTSFNSSKDDKKFIGSWSGSESDNQIVGVTKYWIQHRFKNGTYVLLYTTITDCEVENFVEKGKWFIKDGLFHETHTDSGVTDVYNYEIIDDNHIKFKAKKMGISQANNEYEFIDSKIED